MKFHLDFTGADAHHLFQRQLPHHPTVDRDVRPLGIAEHLDAREVALNRPQGLIQDRPVLDDPGVAGRVQRLSHVPLCVLPAPERLLRQAQLSRRSGGVDLIVGLLELARGALVVVRLAQLDAVPDQAVGFIRRARPHRERLGGDNRHHDSHERDPDRPMNH